MRLQYTSMDHWPRLAWLARARRSSPTLEVFHGPQVETTAEWFCEAVWDGAFAAGDFDRTDVVFGSGGRLRGRSVSFVSSATTVDRAWMDQGLAPAAPRDARSVVPRVWTAPARALNRLLNGIARLSPRHLCPLQSLGARVATYVSGEPHRYLLAWALDRARRGYSELTVAPPYRDPRASVSGRPQPPPRPNRTPHANTSVI